MWLICFQQYTNPLFTATAYLMVSRATVTYLHF